MVGLACFQKLGVGSETLADKFKGALAPGKPVPDPTLAYAGSVVSILLFEISLSISLQCIKM
jgi:hypothetical protein